MFDLKPISLSNLPQSMTHTNFRHDLKFLSKLLSGHANDRYHLDLM